MEERIKCERCGGLDRGRRRESTSQRNFSHKRSPKPWNVIAPLFHRPDDPAWVVRPGTFALFQEWAHLLKVGGVELRLTMSYRYGNPAIYGTGQNEATIVVGMLADQVDPSRGTGHDHRFLPKLIPVCLNGTLLNLP